MAADELGVRAQAGELELEPVEVDLLCSQEHGLRDHGVVAVEVEEGAGQRVVPERERDRGGLDRRVAG